VTPAIDLVGLGRRYGAQYVFRDLTLRVSAGKVVVLRGSNGAGKTTLLKVLATRLRPSRGEGRIFGYDLAKQAEQVRPRVAYLSVLGGSYGTLTALENLRLAATLYQKKLSERALHERLEEVGLGAAKAKLARSFSSGMKKRLAIARLLLSDADVWLLDEPYAALDEQGKALIDELLVRAKAQGVTVMMASHDALRRPEVIDAVLLLEQGRLTALPHERPEVALHG
jgi:heme exporter protein A